MIALTEGATSDWLITAGGASYSVTRSIDAEFNTPMNLSAGDPYEYTVFDAQDTVLNHVRGTIGGAHQQVAWVSREPP